MRYLSREEILALHRLVIAQSGGSAGIRDYGVLRSAVAQPHITFDGVDLYPSLPEKAAALAFSLVCNHPFVDGNKRIGHAAMETFLVMNGYELAADVDEQERVILGVASGKIAREAFTDWVDRNMAPRNLT